MRKKVFLLQKHCFYLRHVHTRLKPTVQNDKLKHEYTRAATEISINKQVFQYFSGKIYDKLLQIKAKKKILFSKKEKSIIINVVHFSVVFLPD